MQSENVPTARFDSGMGSNRMPGFQCLSQRNWPVFAAFLLAFGLTCPAWAAMQNDAGVVGIVKPDAPNPDAAKTDTAKAVSPKPDATTDGSKPGQPTDPKARKTYAAAIDWEKARDYNEALDSFSRPTSRTAAIASNACGAPTRLPSNWTRTKML
jgi:TolA-binding protein